MTFEDVPPEILISLLSWHPHYMLDNSMIRICGSIQSTVFQRPLEAASLGPLDRLPTELQHFILNMLDFRSVTRFSRVCHRSKADVETLPAYRDLIKHAPTALIALSKTKLITFHSAASIHAVLRSEVCVCCPNYAPFVFLPTCERCCFECLHRNGSLRVIPSHTARSCFGVSQKDLKQIPAMLSLPGTYCVGWEVTRRQRMKLVSLKQAKELGIAVFGSEDAMHRFVNLQNAGKLTQEQLRTVHWLTRSFAPIASRPFSTLPSAPNTPKDQFCGMASIKLPTLRPDGTLENGLWCSGCRRNSETHDRGVSQALLALERQGRTRSDFLEHVKQCTGARDIYHRLEGGNQPIEPVELELGS